MNDTHQTLIKLHKDALLNAQHRRDYVEANRIALRIRVLNSAKQRRAINNDK